MMQIFSDPRAFNYLIMALYAANALRWAWYRSWGDAAYWFAALQITAAVTWGYRR